MMACQHPAHDPSIYRPEPATLLDSEAVTALERRFRVQLDCGRPLGHRPGQFVQVSLPGIGEAPISVSSTPDVEDHFELVVRKVGRLTAALHSLPPRSKLGIRGPFGTHFPVAGELAGKDLLFICGGIGLVPVRSAIQYALQRRADYRNVTILYGAKSLGERLFLDELAAWRAREDVALLETLDRGEEGWTGNVGVITTLIPGLHLDLPRTAAIICGPPVMYRFVLLELAKLGLPDDSIYLSLERRMKCGVGKCGHCQMNGFYTCLDGPVFKYSQIKLTPEAI